MKACRISRLCVAAVNWDCKSYDVIIEDLSEKDAFSPPKQFEITH